MPTTTTIDRQRDAEHRPEAAPDLEQHPQRVLPFGDGGGIDRVTAGAATAVNVATICGSSGAWKSSASDSRQHEAVERHRAPHSRRSAGERPRARAARAPRQRQRQIDDPVGGNEEARPTGACRSPARWPRRRPSTAPTTGCARRAPAGTWRAAPRTACRCSRARSARTTHGDRTRPAAAWRAGPPSVARRPGRTSQKATMLGDAEHERGQAQCPRGFAEERDRALGLQREQHVVVERRIRRQQFRRRHARVVDERVDLVVPEPGVELVEAQRRSRESDRAEPEPVRAFGADRLHSAALGSWRWPIVRCVPGWRGSPPAARRTRGSAALSTCS